MHEQIRRGAATRGGDVDVNVLLRGAEKLCGVYELPGARERIAQLRARHGAAQNTMAYYEAKVAEQAEQLASYSKNDWMEEGEEEEGEEEQEEEWTEEDLKREEDEARELDARKRALQTRLRAMDKDLGGLRR